MSMLAPRGSRWNWCAPIALPGVETVHDLHTWPVSTTETALTAHLVMPRGTRGIRATGARPRTPPPDRASHHPDRNQPRRSGGLLMRAASTKRANAEGGDARLAAGERPRSKTSIERLRRNYSHLPPYLGRREGSRGRVAGRLSHTLATGRPFDPEGKPDLVAGPLRAIA